jgi:hypothetical protein
METHMLSVTLLKAFAKTNNIESEEDLNMFCKFVHDLVEENEELEDHINLLEAEVNIPMIQIN